jgi:RNA polymerase sigma factor (sigma-70 family)
MEEDLELWNRWRHSHDQQAFAVLYNRHLDFLVGFVRRRYGDQYLRREAHRVQEAIHETWLRLERVQNVSSDLRPLLARILGNLLVDAHRRDPSRREQPSEEVEAPTETGPVDELLAAEERERLRRCIEKMPEQHRQTYHLLFEQGLTLQEAAQQMGLKHAPAAWARRERMIEWLRQCLAEEGEQE